MASKNKSKEKVREEKAEKKKEKKEKKAKAEYVDLDSIKELKRVKVKPEELQALREEYSKGKKLPSLEARIMAKDMLADPLSGYSYDISSPSMRERKDSLIRSFQKDLLRYLKMKRAVDKYRVRVIDKKNELVFFFDERAEKKPKKEKKEKKENGE